MHYQLFFPGRTSNGRQCLMDAGLSDMTSGITEAVNVVNGQQGLFVSWTGTVSVEPERQQWLSYEGVPYCVGLWRDQPVTPQDLVRPSVYSGEEIPMGDGQRWLVPTAVWLPTTKKRVGGRWVDVRKAAFDRFWHDSEVWFRRMMTHDGNLYAAAQSEGLSDDELSNQLTDFVLSALRLNYRLVPEVASELCLFDTETVISALMMVIRWMNVEEVLKQVQEKTDAVEAGLEKKTSDGSGPSA